MLYIFLQPIQSTLVSFFTLTLDIILVFLLSKEGFNILMMITCKFSKRVILIEKKDI